MDIKEKIESLINKINKAHKAGRFPDFIESIRFPYYKSLICDAKIVFDFPLTVLIGINGSGKSSALHAIYGCPDRSSIGDFWFSTPLDPIRQNYRKGSIPSIIYTYKNDDEILEVIKRRVGVSKGLDYWETSRPVKMYGMKPLQHGKRNPPIKKEVIFLDFRSEMSAFDKFFHFGDFKGRKTITSKQDYIRKYAEYIKRGLNTNVSLKVYSRTSDPAISYGKQGVEILSNILGKSYTNCNILFHNFYGSYGATVLFQNEHKRYSEAFAGRGEFAVAKLVYEVLAAEEGSLIILDEPEVSLHPNAVERLKLFLLEYCLKKKLQIVISTHSPKLVEYLPDNAIKLFFEEENGEFNILNKCSYFKAFAHIGERIDTDNKKIIVVEDNIAKEILDAVINELGEDYPLLFQVVYYPGGAEDIYKSSVLYSQEKEFNKFIVLDGDKRKPQFDPQEFTVKETEDLNFLKNKLKEITNCDFNKLNFKIDGGNDGGDKIQKVSAIIEYLRYNINHMGYFPLNTPEELIWNDDYAAKLLSADGVEMPTNINDFKQKFVKFSELFYQSSSSANINSSQKKFIQNFVKGKTDNYKIIVNILEKFRN